MTNPIGKGDKGGRLNDDEVARLSEQIAGLTSSGLPLAPGLRATAEEMGRGRLRSALESIAAALDRGASLEEAVAAQGNRLPGHLRGLVLIGARTGKISRVLTRFVAFANVGVELRRQLWIRLAYPILSIVISFGLFAFICTALVGKFEQIFRDFGISLPVITIGLIQLSHLFVQGWKGLGEVFVGLGVIWLLTLVVLGAPARRSLMSGLPALGAVWWNTSLAEFCHLLGLLLECDVPLGEALRLSGDGVCDSSIDRACVAMGTDVDGGMSLSQALLRRPVFPRGLARVLHWAEGHQSLPESLHMAGEMFEARARTQAEVAGTVLAVIAVLSILTGIAALVIGLLLPLLTLISKLSG